MFGVKLAALPAQILRVRDADGGVIWTLYTLQRAIRVPTVATRLQRVKGSRGATKRSATDEGATTGTLAAPHRATRTGEARGTAKSGPYRRWTRASPPPIAARRPHR